MKWPVKLLIGFVAVLVLGWIWHGPAGRGEAFAEMLETEARAAIAPIGIPNIQVHMARHPLRRIALMTASSLNSCACATCASNAPAASTHAASHRLPGSVIACPPRVRIDAISALVRLELPRRPMTNHRRRWRPTGRSHGRGT